MSLPKSNLFWRVLSACILLPVVLALLFAGTTWTAVLLAVAAALVAREFLAISVGRFDLAQLLAILVSAAMPLTWALLPERFPNLALGGLMALLVATHTYYLLRGPHAEAPVRAALVMTAAIHGGLLLGSVAALRSLEGGLDWVLLLLIVTFANDTGAYFTGRALGRHKLHPKISPGKTWEGFFGGAVFSCAGALIAGATFFPELTPARALIVALPASILGPLGDLSESMLKRAYGKKDSGNIIPGHGGMLDRVDALLFNAPYLLLCASCFARQ